MYKIINVIFFFFFNLVVGMQQESSIDPLHFNV